MRSFRCLAGRPVGPGNWGALAQPSDPVQGLLARLRTRTITLLLEGRTLTGKLVSLHPITLVAADGKVIVVRLKAIQAVIF